MKTTDNGVEIQNVFNAKVGTVFFDEDNMYIAIGAKPILIKHISDDVVDQLGWFFFFLGKNPEQSAKRIDFPALSIRVEESIIYFIAHDKDKTTLIFENVGPSEMKKFGMWLRKR